MHTISIEYDKTPEEAIELAINVLNARNSRRADEYVLKVCGRDEYLFGSEQLIKYEVINNQTR